MRILHVISTLDPHSGGPPMIAAKLAAAQARLGHQVRIVTAEDPARRDDTAKALQGIPDFEKVNVIRLPQPGPMQRLLGWGLRRPLTPQVQWADVVHLHSVWESILRIAASVARRHRTPYFNLLNGMLDPWSLQQSALKKKVALALGYRRMLNGASALHVGNADEKRLIEPLRLKTKAIIIPNGVFLEEIADLPQRGSFYAMHPELRGEPYVLFLSRLHYKKGLDYLAGSFALVAQRVRDVRLVVAGPDGGERAKFESLIARAGIGDRVHVVGALYGLAKFAALVDATCFCLPSRQEGFSVAITEALGCGLPVVITEGCHFPEVAEVGAGIVAPLDETQVADGLVQVLSDAELRKGMSAAGRRLVETKLNWPAIAQQTLDMYAAARRSG